MVGQVIAGNGGEDHVTQAETEHGCGHPLGFGGIERGRGFSLLYLAEGTAAGADGAPQQERGGAGGVALAAVGAAALLADGVQPLLFHHPLHGFQGTGVADG